MGMSSQWPSPENIQQINKSIARLAREMVVSFAQSYLTKLVAEDGFNQGYLIRQRADGRYVLVKTELPAYKRIARR